MKEMEIFVILVICLFGFSSSFEGTFEERFNHYETLHRSSIHHTVKRSAHINLNQRVVSVTTHGKHFKIHLQTARGLFSPDFTALAVEADGSSNRVNVDPHDFYEGYVEDEQNSRVHAHWENEDLAATIETEEDVYVIEPSWRHFPASDRYSMVSYRMSDMKKKAKADLGKSFCGYVHPDHDEAAADHYLTIKLNQTVISDHAIHSRQKRQTNNNKKVCEVALVADYHFYNGVGSSSETTTINYMVIALTFANNIFKGSTFSSGMGSGYEMQVKTVIVNKAPTAVSNGALHYNMPVSSGKNWAVKTLLQQFSKVDWTSVCLAHLFTHQDFADGVLGLGWIASAQSGTTGGICSTNTGGNWYNTAFSSTMNSGGNRLSTLEANLVLTHEFGHNWGSPHDPSNCAPSSTNGGKHLMYQYSVNGYEANNQHFSTCSLSTIGSVMAKKKDACFVASTAQRCGNGIVETGEQCDAGAAGLAGSDLCCGVGCRFNAKYKCSDVNSVCCSNCFYAASSKQCSFSGQYTQSCQQNAFCDGVTPNCPSPTNKTDNTTCGDQGECQSGECKSFCQLRGLEDCQCQDTLVSCKRCCRAAGSTTCSPVDISGGGNTYVNQPDGKPCVIGYCSGGVCTKQVVSLTERTWSLIPTLTRDGILEFMRSNIILTTVVLSLVIYIPIVIIVLCIDWRLDAEDDDDVDWHNRENDKLVREDADTVIRPTYTRRRGNRAGASEHSTRLSGVNVGM